MNTDVPLPEILNSELKEYFNEKSAHNSYLAFLAETGLVGSLPYLLMSLILLVTGFKAVKFIFYERGNLACRCLYKFYLYEHTHVCCLNAYKHRSLVYLWISCSCYPHVPK